MELSGALKKNREAFLDRHTDASDWMARFFSAATYSLWRCCSEEMAAHCRGLVLDAGSGRGSWRTTILTTATGYESIDRAPRGEDAPTWIGDLEAMPQVPGDRYDTVVCHQVLEHVQRPWVALRELHRVLKPGGKAIVSVPHLSRRHELPNDYFRFTQEGLASLLEDCGYAVLRMQPIGGVLTFLHHQTSFLFPGLLAGVPVLGWLAAALNAPLSWLIPSVDRIVDRRHLIPTGVLAIARKPG